MLGLAVLFSLALWIVGTLLAMRLGGQIGARMGKKKGAPQKGKRIGIAAGFILAMGLVFLYWALEMIAAETMVAVLCATKAGNRIILSPEEHARRVRSGDWEGVKRAEVKDRTNGPYVIGKIITLDGKDFWMDNREAAGEFGSIIQLGVPGSGIYPRFIWHTHYMLYDVEHRVPLYYTEGFQIRKYGSLGLRFWLNEHHGCYYSIVSHGYDTLLAQYERNLKRGEQE